MLCYQGALHANLMGNAQKDAANSPGLPVFMLVSNAKANQPTLHGIDDRYLDTSY